jgi:hypothetical protein
MSFSCAAAYSGGRKLSGKTATEKTIRNVINPFTICACFVAGSQKQDRKNLFIILFLLYFFVLGNI